MIYSFTGKDAADLDLAERAANGQDWGMHLSMTDVVMVPAACYPAYPAMALRGPLPKGGVTLDLGGSVDILGYRSDVIRVLAGSDIFVLASLYEGYPVAVMEALAIGLPIVATAVGGIPQAVREGVEGLLVPPRRPELLADAIETLVRDPGRRLTMGEAAEARGRRYDIVEAVRRTEQIYRDIVDWSRP